jgi:hypothetical protein
MALALVRPVSTFRPQKHRRSRMGNMSMLVLPRPEDQSRVLEENDCSDSTGASMEVHANRKE